MGTIDVEGLWHVPEVLIVSHARSVTYHRHKPELQTGENFFAFLFLLGLAHKRAR